MFGRLLTSLSSASCFALAHWWVNSLEGIDESKRLVLWIGLNAAGGALLLIDLFWASLSQTFDACTIALERWNPHPLANRRGIGPVEMALLAANLAVVVGLTTCVFHDAPAAARMVREDGPIQNLTAVLYAVAAGAHIYCAWRCRNAFLRRNLVALAVLFGIVCMEEISWGQRLFGFHTPELLGSVNVQREFTLHNVFSTSLTQYAALFVTTTLLFLAPLANRYLPRARRLFVAASFPAPAPAYAAVYAVAAIAFILIGLRFGTTGVGPFSHRGFPPNTDDEFLEFFIACQFSSLAVTFWGVRLQANLRQRTRVSRPSTGEVLSGSQWPCSKAAANLTSGTPRQM